jgi:hypothetical protein
VTVETPAKLLSIFTLATGEPVHPATQFIHQRTTGKELMEKISTAVRKPHQGNQEHEKSGKKG